MSLYDLIISFDPRDAADNGLTVDRAQALGLAYCKEHFPGHQALVCTHPDGHNHSGNIHVHIVINSLRIAEVERKPYMDRASDTRAGDKHRCTAAAMRYFRGEVMEMCHREGLYQIDLLNGSRNKVTEREYWAKRKGQVKLDKENAALLAEGMTVGKPTPNNLTINNLIENQTMGVSGEPHKPFGRYENVFLTEAEYAELKTEFPDRLERFIEEMSRYLAANGRTYQNYAAALRIWAENDKKGAPKQGVPDYTCKEGESL